MHALSWWRGAHTGNRYHTHTHCYLYVRHQAGGISIVHVFYRQTKDEQQQHKQRKQIKLPKMSLDLAVAQAHRPE